MSHKLSGMLKGWRIHVAGAAACTAVTAMMYAFLIYPVVQMQEEYARLSPTLSEKEEALRTARTSLSNIKSDLERTRAEVMELPLRLDSSAQVNSRLARIAELADQQGLELHAMQPKDPWGGDRYDMVPISLTGQGDYRKVTGFMREIHKQFADIAVIDFSLTSAGAGSDEAQFGIGLAWYTMPVLGMVEN